MADKFLKSLNIGDGNIYKPLPLVTSDDNDKILMVTGGEWGAEYAIDPGIISFKIEDTTYKAEKDMKFSEWIISSYNTGDFTTDGELIFTSDGHPLSPDGATFYYAFEPIMPNFNYPVYRGE